MNHLLTFLWRIIISTFFFLNVQSIVAQTISEIKYANGALKTRYHILQKDTFCIENWFDNGNRYSISWRDSVHYFYPNQTIALKTVGKKPYSNSKWRNIANPDMGSPRYNDYLAEKTDVAKTYYEEGQLHEISFCKGDSLLTDSIFAPNGRLLTAVFYEKQNNHLFNYIETNGLDIIKITTDTFTRIQKRVYYTDKSKLKEETYQIDITETTYPAAKFKILKRTIWNEQGQITFAWATTDATLHIDKDNGLCLYGLRNERDEWVVKPQYDYIEIFNNIYFIVNQNNKYSILDKYGNIVIPLEYDDLFELGANNYKESFAKSFEALYLGEPTQASPPSLSIELAYKKNGLYGVMDFAGKTILKPVYQDIRKYKNELYEVKIGGFWSLVDVPEKTIIAPRYNQIDFTAYPDLFITSDTTHVGNKIVKRHEGLVNAQGKTLLPITTDLLLATDALYNRCFWADVPGSYHGLFHAEQGWILDTNHFCREAERNIPFSNHLNKYKIFYQQDRTDKKKYGVLETSSPAPFLLLPFDYQLITFCTKKNYYFDDTYRDHSAKYRIDTLFHCVKDEKHGLFDPKQQKWVLPLRYDTLFEVGDSLFLALYQQKWQFINRQGSIVLPETFDAGGVFSFQHPFQIGDWINGCFVVKKDSLFFYSETSFPARTTLKDLSDDFYPLKKHTSKRFSIQDWQFNPDGKILLSPEYKQVWAQDGYTVVRHKRTNQQQLIDTQGNKQLFLSKYHIKQMNIKQNWVLAQDTATKQLGMMTVAQQVILPCQYFAMSGLEHSSYIWARKDKPLKNKGLHIELDSLNGNWQLYDKKGKLVTNILFDNPIDWEQSLAVGQVRGKQGIWKATGQNVLPPKYDKIVHDTANQVFYLFNMQADSSYRVGFANADGQVIIDAIFLNMSRFSNQDAFVETEKGYGLIQKKGNYRIEPSPNALQQASFDIKKIVNLLRTEYDEIITNSNTFNLYTNLAKVNAHLDTIPLEIPRFKIENLLLEQMVSRYFLLAKRNDAPRIPSCYFGNDGLLWNLGEDQAVIPLKDDQLIEDVFCNRRAICFSSRFLNGSVQNQPIKYHNFCFKNNIWQDSKLEDVLFWNKATEMALNQLLVQKISALKNQAMDCGNPDTYMERVKTKFYMVETGLQFFMPRYTYDDSYNTLPILLTWAELKPYLLN